jgi:hypothetical protein
VGSLAQQRGMDRLISSGGMINSIHRARSMIKGVISDEVFTYQRAS